MPVRPWKRVADGPAADHGVLKVRNVRVADPRNGREHSRVVIESPDWVNVVALTPDEQVVLVRQFRFGIGAETLELPGGMVDGGESPEQAASRELEEETGYRPREIRPLGFCHPNPAIQTNRTWSFLALGCERVHDGRQEAGEDIEVELVDRAKLLQLVRDGAITHALVLVALFFERLGREV